MGATTGSVHADRSRRPYFSWRSTPGATRYELEVDDSCQTPSFRTCVFDSPELREVSVGETYFVPGAGLPVSMSAPVGRRYFWRVRGCNAHGCGEWSDVWYVDVGRLNDDVNGDGYGDLLIGIDARTETATRIGAAYIAFGRSGPGSITITKLPDPANRVDGRFGRKVAIVGDVNADGYQDVVVGAWNENNARPGAAYLYLGRGTWPGTVAASDTEFALVANDPATSFGGSVTGRGDMNGDGYADIAIGSLPADDGQPTVSGYVHVNFGRASYSFSQLGSDLVVQDPAGDVMGLFGMGTAFGDLDEDGLTDLVIGAPASEEFSGVAHLYLGRATYPATPYIFGASDVMLASPASGVAFFGTAAVVCGSSPEEPVLAIGAPAESRPAANAGVTRLYRAPAPGSSVVTESARTLTDPSGALSAGMGSAIKCGDVTGDGKDDLVVGAPTGDDAGTVYVYGDVANLPTTPLAVLSSGSSLGTLGTSVAVTDFDGDGVADIFAGAPNLGTAASGAILGWMGRSVWPGALSSADITIDNPSGMADERFGRSLD